MTLRNVPNEEQTHMLDTSSYQQWRSQDFEKGGARRQLKNFRPEATPTNYSIIIVVSGGRNYIERGGSCPAM